MKAFQVEEHGISFVRVADGSKHPLRDIDENDVLAIISLIIDGGAVEMDPVPETDAGRNPAEFIIYKELHSQFKKVCDEREGILKRIDDQFADARAYYEGDGLKNALLDLGQP
ncbi:hypothetical protein [Paratractidigestivibacter sp.]|uniref:hypothetical protein n=1 Tax=Paratractidigestivibacter sp. TaxID=2847316 RepID=UPI002AC8A348|nr:hypothetical protein [Paratractidigestivibacter sp.]